MSRADLLKSLEIVLESFLDRAVAVKDDRLKVLDGLNRLDDIARGIKSGKDMTDDIGSWFARHADWLEDETKVRPADKNRVSKILESVKSELSTVTETSPASEKIGKEIDRWNETILKSRQKLVLKRRPEVAVSTEGVDTKMLFASTLEDAYKLFGDISLGRPHLLSVLDEALKRAELQENPEALILSGYIIYYLKQHRYMVEPYVKRLKAAEQAQKAGSTRA